MACAVVCLTLMWGGGPALAHTPHDDISDVAISPDYADDHTVFVISRGRLMRSTDRGTTWREIVRGLGDEGQVLAGVAVAPSDPDVLYLMTRDQGVLRSDNRGTSWRPANGGLSERNLQGLAVSPVSADIAVVAPNTPEGGLFRTTDGGGLWSRVGPSDPVTSLAFLPDGRRVVAGDAHGRVTTSRDAGEAWDSPVELDRGHAVSAVAVGAAGEEADTVFAATASGRLFRSDDGGREFAPLGDGLPDEEVRSLELSPAYPDDATLWASTWHSGVYVSTDRGETWERMADGLTMNSQADDVGVPQFRTVAAVAERPGRHSLFVGGFDGLFRFDDRRGSWTPIETLTDHIVGLAVSPNFADDRTIAVTTYVKGAFLSRDGGNTWGYANEGLGDEVGNTFVPLRRLHNVQFSPDYANDGTIFSANWDDVVRSTDRGRSWHAVTVSPPLPGDRLRQFVLAVSPAFASDRTVFAATRHGEVFRSEEAGDPGTWDRLGGFGDDERVRSLAASPDYSSDRTLYAGTAAGVYRSDDGARTWTATGPRMATPPEGGEDDLGALVAMSPDYGSDGTVFAGTDGGLFVTRNAGRTWAEVTVAPLTTSSQVEAVAVSPAYTQDRTVLVSTRELGLLRSTDGGRSFQRVGVGLFDANRIIADFSNPTSMPIQFSPTFATDRTVFAYAQTDVLRSTDGGQSWEVLPLPSSREVLERVGPAPGPRWFETPIGNLSWRRVLAAVGAGVLAFAALSVLRVGGRRSGAPLALHFGVGLAVLAVGLVVLAK
ncbi:MAG: WD40/YVTN/BNR-like repeat-containing protein [Acidimicrobiales bacterium]